MTTSLEEQGRSSWMWMMYYINQLKRYNAFDPARADYNNIRDSIYQYNQEWLDIQEQIKARGKKE